MDYSYLSMVTGATITDPVLYQNTIKEYKDGNYDIEKDILFGMKNSTQLESVDAFRIQMMLSRNPVVVKNLLKYYKDPDKDTSNVFSYVTPILNEFSSDNKEEAEKICKQIVENYDKTSSEIEDSEFRNYFIRTIRSKFIPTEAKDVEHPKTFMDLFEEDVMKKIQDAIDEYNSDEEITEAGIGDAVKEGWAKFKSKSEKIFNVIQDQVNRIRKIWKERSKKEYYDRYFNDNWRLKRTLKRILWLCPVAFASVPISLIVYFWLKMFDWKNDLRHRAMAVKELETEIKIIDEKISYADRDSNREAKVEMMRMRDKLENLLKDLKSNKIGGLQ